MVPVSRPVALNPTSDGGKKCHSRKQPGKQIDENDGADGFE